MNVTGGTLAPGTRVRIAAPQAGLMLVSRIGTVVRADDDDADYYVIRLDQPAHYDRGLGGPPERLSEIVELADNLRVMVGTGSIPVGSGQQRVRQPAPKNQAAVKKPKRQD